jgi:uncharacterized protein YbjT (DUF2867 family)
MTKPTILVSGATGKTGLAVVRELKRLDYPVRALVRATSARTASLAQLGVDVVTADPYDPQQLLEAMRGVQRAYYVPPFDPYMVHGALAFAIAANDAGLESVVGLTQWLSNPQHPAYSTRQHWTVDRMFAMLPRVAHTTINPGFFADNYLRLLPMAVHLRLFPDLYGDGQCAPPSNDDIARVVVACLADPSAHHGAVYHPTGPKLLSPADMHGIFEQLTGQRILRLKLPQWLAIKAMMLDGADPFQISDLFDFIEDNKRGAFALNGVTKDVEKLTGRPAEAFEETARHYLALPQNQPSFSNKLKTLIRFALTPMSRGMAISHYRASMQIPMHSAPVLSIDSGAWRRAHAAPIA